MIHGQGLNHRLFQLFCEEMGKKHTVFLYHTKVRRLSRGRVPSQLFELQDEIQKFLGKAGHDLAGYFDEPEFIQAHAYLSDVFIALNELNCSLWQREISILVACKKLSAFKGKLVL